MKGRILVAGIVLTVLLFTCFPCTADEASRTEEPLTIVSDRLDAYDDTMTVVFSGNVVVTQRDITMKSDTLNVFYSKEKTGVDEVQKKNPLQEGTVKKIEAQGSVHVLQGDKTVTGDRAVFFNQEQRIEVTGNVVMKDGANVIEGEKATFFIAENRGIVESSPLKRVKATIYPGGEIKKP